MTQEVFVLTTEKQGDLYAVRCTLSGPEGKVGSLTLGRFTVPVIAGLPVTLYRTENPLDADLFMQDLTGKLHRGEA